jgi:hypothetical protein
MAGTFPGVCNAQQFDINGNPMAGGLLTVYAGGTTTLAATFQDIGLTLPSTNPLVADASGRLPLFFVADGQYALRLTDANGIQTSGGFYYPQIPSIGASSSGGGGSVVDPTTVFSTGDAKWRLEESTIAGWVRVNGRTIGNASSGATERANADTQALYVYIWQTYPDGICPVVGGRGASALADFSAGKQITLLDSRGRAIFGLDDMGNSAAGAFSGVTFQKGNTTTGGSSAGANSTTLQTSNLPPYTPSGTVVVSPIGALHGSSFNTSNQSAATDPGGTLQNSINLNATFTGSPQGGTSTPFPAVPRAILGTLFWKL